MELKHFKVVEPTPDSIMAELDANIDKVIAELAHIPEGSLQRTFADQFINSLINKRNRFGRKMENV